jgi:hypothetical protein
MERVPSHPIACQCTSCCQRVAATLRAIRAGGRPRRDLPSTTKSTEAKPATESTVEAKARPETAMEGEGTRPETATEAKARSETAMEGEGAGSESTAEAKARSETAMEGESAGSESTVEAKARSESTMEAKATMEGKAAMEAKATTEAKPTSETAMEAKAASAKAASAKAASAEADCGKAVIARVHNTEGALAGKGRRSQRRTGCRNRHGGQTDCYLAHHDAHSNSEHPSLSESNSAFLSGLQPCGTVARSAPERPVRKKAAFSPHCMPRRGVLVP